jgi:hypothetical protein
VRLLVIVPFLLSGCNRSTDEAEQRVEAEELTIEIARSALIEMLDSPDFEAKVQRFPSGKAYLHIISRDQLLDSLRNAEPNPLDEGFKLGPWYVALDRRRFNSVGKEVRNGEVVFLGGRFQQTKDGKWKAWLLGTGNALIRGP